MTKPITVIDGGFSTVIERKGIDLTNDPLWTARLLQTNPSAVVEVHKSYLASGADIITTASYQASIDGFRKALQLTEEESIKLMKSSVDLAKQARDEYSSSTSKSCDKNILIAGSIGPYGASLADGSEYTGEYCDSISHWDLVEWHRPRMKCLVDAGVDLLAIETIPGQKEGEALMKLLHEFPAMRAWLSFSCQSAHENSHKEGIGMAAKNCAKIASPHQLIAIGVNCCKPSYVSSLLKDISSSVPGFPKIAYPNSGESWISGKGWCNPQGISITKYLESWIEASIDYVGGCCRIGPDDIAEIVQFLKERNV